MDSESSDAMYREQRIKDHYQVILRKEIQRQQESEGQVVSFSAEVSRSTIVALLPGIISGS